MSSKHELTPAEIKEAQDTMLQGFMDALESKDDTAKVNAASKVLDGANDLSLPIDVRERFMEMRHIARKALLWVVKNAEKEPARVSASEYLKKIIKENAPAIWPPDQTKDKWKQDLKQAEKLCGLN